MRVARLAMQIGVTHLGEKEVGTNRGDVVEWALRSWGHPQGGTFWCAGFVSTCILEALTAQGLKDYHAQWLRIGSASCDALWARCATLGWTSSAKSGDWMPGDLVFWGSTLDLDHVGFVESVNTFYAAPELITIEGNSQDAVSRRNRPLRDNRLAGRVRIPWEAPD